MEELVVKLNNRQWINIDKAVFVALLDISYIKEYKDYINALETNAISFKKLRDLAIKAAVPYPLFFAPASIAHIQLCDKNKQLEGKIPSKEEMRISSRGRVAITDIELIAKDLCRKQEFLKQRILPKADSNQFIGIVAGMVKERKTIAQIAEVIRNFLEIDLMHLRSISKEKVLGYLTACSESKGILISFSSYNYMPQNIHPELELSGICIRDKKFPYIFINTRDGDEKPKIIESSGRQIFTLLSMLSCIAMGKFVLSSKFGKSKEDTGKLAYAIAGEILIPQGELKDIEILTLEGLKEKAHFFRVTPSMLLYRLRENNKIETKLAASFKQSLRDEVKKAEPKKRNAPLPTTAYGKYNGARFSKEVVRAYNAGLITQDEVKNIFFRQGKMDMKLLSEYIQKYRS